MLLYSSFCVHCVWGWSPYILNITAAQSKMIWWGFLFCFTFLKSWDLTPYLQQVLVTPFGPVLWWSTSVSTLHECGCEKKVHVCDVYTLHCHTSELWFPSSWIPCLPAHAVLIHSALVVVVEEFSLSKASWRSPSQEHGLKGNAPFTFLQFYLFTERGGWWGGHGFWPTFNKRRGSCKKLLV